MGGRAVVSDDEGKPSKFFPNFVWSSIFAVFTLPENPNFSCYTNLKWFKWWFRFTEELDLQDDEREQDEEGEELDDGEGGGGDDDDEDEDDG